MKLYLRGVPFPETSLFVCFHFPTVRSERIGVEVDCVGPDGLPRILLSKKPLQTGKPLLAARA